MRGGTVLTGVEVNNSNKGQRDNGIIRRSRTSNWR